MKNSRRNGGIFTNIALINGSPKVKDSASGVILKGLKGMLPSDAHTQELFFRTAKPSDETLAKAVACDTLVFALPLYVDGLPSNVIGALLELQTALQAAPKQARTVYAVVNCGFYEGKQNRHALEMMENWCNRAGIHWGQGIGVGAGGMLAGLESVPMGKGPNTNLGQALRTLVKNLESGAQADSLFITANFPRFAYKAVAEFGWRQQGKANGLKTKALFAKPGWDRPQ